MLNQGLGGRVSVPTRHGPYSLAGRSLPGKQERISSIEHQRGRHGRTLLVHKSHGHSHGSTQKVREHDFYMNDFTKGKAGSLPSKSSTGAGDTSWTSGVGLALIMCFVSSLASVCNELLLKVYFQLNSALHSAYTTANCCHAYRE